MYGVVSWFCIIFDSVFFPVTSVYSEMFALTYVGWLFY